MQPLKLTMLTLALTLSLNAATEPTLTDKAKAKVTQLKTKYTCWKNDGYTYEYTTILGFTIKTFEECE